MASAAQLGIEVGQGRGNVRGKIGDGLEDFLGRIALGPEDFQMVRFREQHGAPLLKSLLKSGGR